MKRKSAYAKLAVISLTALLTSCKDKEPDIYMCAIVNGTVAQCVPSNKSKPEYDINVVDMLGFICVSPEGFGAIKKHHENLHKELESR